MVFLISRSLYFLLLVIVAVQTFGAATQNFGPTREMRVAFIFPSSISDFGWSYIHELGRVSAEMQLQAQGYNVTTSFTPAVESTEAGKVMQEYIDAGYQLIIAAGAQFGDIILSVANKNPTVNFACTASTVSSANVAVGFPRNWDVAYLMGYGCALQSKTKQLGFISAFVDNFDNARASNSFYIGAKTADSSVEVTLATVSSFFDPVTEEKAAIALMNETNADCIGSMVNDNTVNTVAGNRGVFSIESYSDARFTSGEYVLSSTIFDWAPFFSYWIQRAYNGTWVPNESIYWGFSQNAIKLAPFGTKTDPAVKRAVKAELARVQALGDSFNVFCGKYATQWNANGSCLSLEQIVTIDTPLNDYSSTAAIAAIVWAALFTALLLISLVDLVIYRDTVAYRTSSPLFCAFIGVGVLMIYISIFGWIGVPTNNRCSVRAWPAGLGFALIYGCVLAKNWRVFRIFSDDSFKVFAITNFDLTAKFLSPIVGIELLILILWQVLDPLVPIVVPSPLAVDTRLQFCSSKTSVGLIVILLFKAVLLIAASTLSYLTRRITSDFRESLLIALSVYNAIVIGLIIIIINLLVVNNVELQFIITVFGFLLIASVTHGLVFFPKFYRIHVVGDKQAWSLSSQSQGNNASMNSLATNSSKGSRGSAPRKDFLAN